MHQSVARPVPGAPAGRLLDGLSPEQHAAVCHPGGPLLILAGPGAGKTRTITHRVAWLMATGRAAPSEIVAVTFTVRAASEMKLRLIDMLGVDAAGALTIKTFHALCARLLKAHAAVYGRDQHFTIYDPQEIAKLIDCHLHTVATQPGATGRPVMALSNAEVGQEISLAKNRLWTVEFYEAHRGHPAAALIAGAWRAVDRELAQSNAFGFDDLLVYAVALLSEHPQLAARYRQRWRHVLVDEYQDTNAAQAALLYLLCGRHGDVTVVADDDQAVYRFRGAQVANVLEFGRTYPGRRVIVLGRNYRSTSEILTAAVACVSHNRDRAPKQLVAMRGPGGSVATPRFSSDEREAAWVADTIAWYRAQGITGDEILVMIRNVGQGGYWIRALTRALHERAISYRVLGSLGLYERKEVRDALGYLALIANPYDAGALRRVLGFPARGAGAKTTAAVVAWARDRDLDLLASCRHARRLSVIRGDRVRERLAVLGDELTRVRGLTSSRSLGHVVCEALMIRDGPVCHLQHRRDHAARAEDRHDAERVLEDLRSLAAAAGAFEREHPDDHSLGAFVHHAIGLGGEEIDGRDERVTISTIHRAKGAEAKVAFLLACEEGQLPSWRAVQEGTVEAISEERRLFYVALTRAKDRAYLCHAARRRDRATQAPSRFLREAQPRT